MRKLNLILIPILFFNSCKTDNSNETILGIKLGSSKEEFVKQLKTATQSDFVYKDGNYKDEEDGYRMIYHCKNGQDVSFSMESDFDLKGKLKIFNVNLTHCVKKGIPDRCDIEFWNCEITREFLTYFIGKMGDNYILDTKSDAHYEYYIWKKGGIRTVFSIWVGGCFDKEGGFEKKGDYCPGSIEFSILESDKKNLLD